MISKTIFLALITITSSLFAEEEHYTQKIFRKDIKDIKDINVEYLLTDEYGCVEIKNSNNKYDNNYLKFTNLDDCLKKMNND